MCIIRRHYVVSADKRRGFGGQVRVLADKGGVLADKGGILADSRGEGDNDIFAYTAILEAILDTYTRRGIHGSTFVHFGGSLFSAGKALASGR